MDTSNWSRDLVAPVLQLARTAGSTILSEQALGLHVHTKPDGSPVSTADKAAEAVIIAGLKSLTPAYPVVAEESFQSTAYDATSPYWLVDPLDGTKSFLAGTDDFTTNIALMIAQRPVFGVIYAPARRALFWNDTAQTWHIDADAKARTVTARRPPSNGLTMITSRRTHTGAKLRSWLEGQKIADQLMLSSALKFCYVAMGAADIYPRLGPTMEWDNAAGEAILHTAGGKVTSPDGSPLLYGQPGFQHSGLVARGRF
ncbi:MAG: 3'(2'),5'-bisphosphate nucleotidase CysQ [Alphaproteobacteria bacterium]|nr:3'(2'),5'-bisphosphate nucleotidase CysQ [Alphaproteobacteria bacterium]